MHRRKSIGGLRRSVCGYVRARVMAESTADASGNPGVQRSEYETHIGQSLCDQGRIILLEFPIVVDCVVTRVPDFLCRFLQGRVEVGVLNQIVLVFVRAPFFSAHSFDVTFRIDLLFESSF